MQVCPESSLKESLSTNILCKNLYLCEKGMSLNRIYFACLFVSLFLAELRVEMRFVHFSVSLENYVSINVYGICYYPVISQTKATSGLNKNLIKRL